MKVLIVVTHLLGTGHLSRALILARAFAAASHETVLASGGGPVPQLTTEGVQLLQLPPLRSDGIDFSRLLDAAGKPATAVYLAERRQILCEALQEMSPDVLITELFPFGRRGLRPEFINLLETARALPRPPLILSSIRDILAPPSKPEKAQETDDWIASFYDGVLVHADPALVPLQQSWPVSPTLERVLHYTGFVAAPPAGPHPEGLGRHEILVSAGGGAVGGPIFDAALKAAPCLPDHHWRLLVGGGPSAIRRLRNAPLPANLTVEPPRPDFRQMLYVASASISMCGYNTTLDLLQAGVPALLIPFDAGNETEQSLRARSLANRRGIAVLPNAELSGQTLARAVVGLLGAGRQKGPAPAMTGSTRTVRIVTDMLDSRP